jgi:hypothetical protein
MRSNFTDEGESVQFALHLVRCPSKAEAARYNLSPDRLDHVIKASHLSHVTETDSDELIV